MITRLVPVGEPPTHFRFSGLAALGLPHITTTRHFPGVTSPAEPTGPFTAEAQQALRKANLDATRLSYLKQVHGAAVIQATAGGLAGNADAIVTMTPGLPIAVFSADCVPLLLYDPEGRRLAAAHAGWRGTVQSVARATVEALMAAGGRSERFLAALGPSIGPCCYEVDKPVIAQLDQAFAGRWGTWVKAAGPGKWMLDLWKANEAQIKEAGLTEAQIDNPRLCTACRTDLFFSYRRRRGQGRLVAVAAIPDGSGPAC